MRNETEQRALIEVSISVDFNQVATMLKGPHGSFAGLVMSAFCWSLLVFLAAGLQTAFPRHFPEVPLYPMVIVASAVGYYVRYAPALLLGALGGALLEASGFLPLGSQMAILMCIVWASNAMKTYFGRPGVFLLPASTGLVAMVIYLAARLAFLKGGMPIARLLQLLVWHVPIAVALNAFALAPLLFALCNARRLFPRKIQSQ